MGAQLSHFGKASAFGQVRRKRHSSCAPHPHSPLDNVPPAAVYLRSPCNPDSALEKIFTAIMQMEADGFIFIRHGLTDKWAAFQTSYLES